MDRLGRALIGHIRRSLLTGLLLLLPIALTYVIIRFIFDLADGVLRPWVEWVVGRFGVDLTLPGPGIVAAVLLIYLVGALATFRLGSIAVNWARVSLLKVPFVGTIYSANRQLIESFSGTSVTGFKRVILVQFPREGSWSLGFLTGVSDAERKLLMTYVPTAPLPNSGFVVLMPPEDVLDTDLTVPDAMQLIFSGGIVSPRTIKTRKIDIEEVERRLRQMDVPSQPITKAVGDSVSSVAARAASISAGKLRRSSARAVREAGSDHGSSSVARDAMIGAMRAVEDLGAPTVDRVRETTKGVVLGVRDATGMTARILYDAVAGAIQAGKGRGNQSATVQGAAEGTMQVAASVGVPPEQAVSQISQAAALALHDSDEDPIVWGRATIKGIIAGVTAAGGDVVSAAQHGAYMLVSNAARTGLNLGSLAAALAEAAVEARAESAVDARRLADAVARGSVKAADEVSDSAGDEVRTAVADRFSDPAP